MIKFICVQTAKKKSDNCNNFKAILCTPEHIKTQRYGSQRGKNWEVYVKTLYTETAISNLPFIYTSLKIFRSHQFFCFR